MVGLKQLNTIAFHPFLCSFQDQICYLAHGGCLLSSPGTYGEGLLFLRKHGGYACPLSPHSLLCSLWAMPLCFISGCLMSYKSVSPNLGHMWGERKFKGANPSQRNSFLGFFSCKCHLCFKNQSWSRGPVWKKSFAIFFPKKEKQHLILDVIKYPVPILVLLGSMQRQRTRTMPVNYQCQQDSELFLSEDLNARGGNHGSGLFCNLF